MAAPIPAVDLDQALRPFGESRMLPALAYLGNEVYAWEQQHFFAGSWTCLGRQADLAAQQALTIGGVAVVLTLEGTTLRAFANVCRHRGHELLADRARLDRGALLCPYPGWSYQFDGRLRTAPRMPDTFHK